MKRVFLAGLMTVAMAAPVWSQQETVRMMTIPGSKDVIVSGTWPKAACGSVWIPYGNVEFVENPNVVVTPHWVSAVGYTETITDINTKSFQISSNNCAPNYTVSWMAMGRQK